MSREASRVIIYGATGHAGQGMARALHANGFEIVVAGQTGAKIERLARQLGCRGFVVALSESERLRALAAGAAVVINCAGPLSLTAPPLAEACLDANTHYLDISGERASVRSLLGLHAAAVRRGVSIVPAAGAKGGLGAWAMALAIEGAGVPEAFEIAYAHAGEAYWRPSPGALLSVAREGVEWETRPFDEGAPPRDFDFPTPFRRGLAVHITGTEEISLPDDPRPKHVRCYLSVDPGTRGNTFWGLTHHPLLAGLTRPPAPVIWRSFIELGPQKLAEMMRAPGDGALALVVEPHSASASHRAVAVSTTSGYGATCATIALCTERLLADGGASRGVLSPATLIPAREALRHLHRMRAVRVLRDGRSPRSIRASESR